MPSGFHLRGIQPPTIVVAGATLVMIIVAACAHGETIFLRNATRGSVLHTLCAMIMEAQKNEMVVLNGRVVQSFLPPSTLLVFSRTLLLVRSKVAGCREEMRDTVLAFLVDFGSTGHCCRWAIQWTIVVMSGLRVW